MSRKYFSMLMYIRLKEYAKLTKAERITWDGWFNDQMKLADRGGYYLC